MAISWYEEMYQSIEKYLKLKIPIELIYFPATGIVSAIHKYSHKRADDKNNKQFIYSVDLRAGLFSSNLEENRKEFMRILRSQLEPYIDLKNVDENDKNILQEISSALRDKVNAGNKIFLVIENANKSNVKAIPDFRDFLVFMDRLRDGTNGAVNILITSTFPTFDDEYPAPIPVISRYYSFYNPQRALNTVTHDIFNEYTVDKATILKVIDFCGWLPGLVKYLERDLSMYYLKPEAVLQRTLDADFFNDFINLKFILDDMFDHLEPIVRDALVQLSLEGDTKELDPRALEYLTKTGALDEQGKLRGKIIPAYCKYVATRDRDLIPSITEANTNAIAAAAEYTSAPAKQLAGISATMEVDLISGQIVVNGQINGDYLSEKELKIFALLLKNRGKEVSREVIAKNIWDENDPSAYSDWAMDKLISRIRVKLGDRKPYHLIKTSRKIGFILS